jgi:hypothetical protein
MELSTKKTRRRYSDREIAGALAIYDNIGNLTEASRITGIPDSTLSGWVTADRKAENPDIPLMRAGYDVSQLANNFEEIAHLSTGEIKGRLRDPKQVKDIPLPHLLKASEVGADKSQLLRGLPTSISESIERQELIIILQSALNAGLDGGERPEDCIDVTPEPKPAMLPPVMPEPVAALAPVNENPGSSLPSFALRRPLNDCPV